MDIQRENRFLFCIWLCLFLFLLFLRGEPPPDSETPASSSLRQSTVTDPAVPDLLSAGSAAPENGSGSADSPAVPSIRVLLTDSSQDGYMHQQVTVSPESDVRVSGSEVCIPAGETVTVTADSPWFSDDRILLQPEDLSAGMAVASVTRAGGIPVYEGTLEIYRTDEGLYLVNEIDLESYLKYVVPSEMPASYAPEALKAQAVCARTYAWRALQENSLADYHAHVDDSVSFQVYNQTARRDSTDRAVDETAGMIMTHGGEPITAYFFSTSCGYTSTSEVWSGGASEEYLKSVYLGSDSPENVQTEEVFSSFIQEKDPADYESEDAWYRWSVTIPVSILSGRAETYGVGEIRDLEVLRRSSGGAATALRITGTAGETVLENEYAIREFLSVKDIPVTKNDGTVTSEMNLLPSACFICSGVYQEGALSGFQILGGGYGHGVGMSQNGAEHLAEQGYGWQEILNYFYKDIVLEQR